jgi:hypothetical protein
MWHLICASPSESSPSESVVPSSKGWRDHRNSKCFEHVQRHVLAGPNMSQKLTVALCSVHLRYVEKWLRYFEMPVLLETSWNLDHLPSDAERLSASLPPRDPSVCGRLGVQHLQRAPSLHPSRGSGTSKAQPVSKNSWQKILVFCLFIYVFIYLLCIYLCMSIYLHIIYCTYHINIMSYWNVYINI